MLAIDCSHRAAWMTQTPATAPEGKGSKRRTSEPLAVSSAKHISGWLGCGRGSEGAPGAGELVVERNPIGREHDDTTSLTLAEQAVEPS
jgi:hypothetical protein